MVTSPRFSTRPLPPQCGHFAISASPSWPRLARTTLTPRPAPRSTDETSVMDSLRNTFGITDPLLQKRCETHDRPSTEGILAGRDRPSKHLDCARLRRKLF